MATTLRGKCQNLFFGVVIYYTVIAPVSCFVSNPAANATQQPPGFADRLLQDPSNANIADAAETLAAKDHLDAYKPLTDALASLLQRPETRAAVISVLNRFPVRSFLPILATALPSEWNGASADALNTASAIAKLRGPSSTGVLLSALNAASASGADQKVVEQLATDLTTADPEQALEAIFSLSGFRLVTPTNAFWLTTAKSAVQALSRDVAHHGALIRIAQETVSRRLVGAPGSYVVLSGPDAPDIQIMRELARGLQSIGTAPALSTLIFFTLSDDPELAKYASEVDFQTLANAPWLAADPTALAGLLQQPEAKVKQLLARYEYPPPTAYPLAPPAEQLLLRRLYQLNGARGAAKLDQFRKLSAARAESLREIDRFVFSNLVSQLNLAALGSANLPDLYNLDDAAPLTSEFERLASVVAFALTPFNLPAGRELTTARYLVRKQYQLLGATLYALLRAEALGIPVGPHSRLSETLAQLQGVGGPNFGVPVTSIVDHLPDPPAADETPIVCEHAEISVKARILSLVLGQYAEELAVACPDGSVKQLRWQGSIPFEMQAPLQVYPRLLDFCGVSLAANEMRASTQVVATAVSELDLIFSYPEQVLPMLVLLWNSSDASWGDALDRVLADVYVFVRAGNVPMSNFSQLPTGVDPMLPPSIAYLASQIPLSGMYSRSQIDRLALLLEDQVKGLLSSRGKAQVLSFARQIVSERMPDTVTRSYQIPCGQPGGMVQYCSGTQVTANNQKHSLLVRYDQDIASARQQEAALLVFDLMGVSSAQITRASLLRGWITPNLDQFLGLYLVQGGMGDRLFFSNVRLDGAPTWAKLALQAAPALLSMYRIDFGGATVSAQQNDPLALAAAAQGLQFAELRQRGALAFAYDFGMRGVSDIPLLGTAYGRFLAREITWNNNLAASTGLGNASSEQTVSTTFKDRISQQWAAVAIDFTKAVGSEQARIKAELDRQLNQGITVGISLTLGGPLPVFGVSLTGGSWTVIVSTNLSNMATVFPAWHGIGVPIPIALGPAAPIPSPLPNQPDVHDEQPVPSEISERQASTLTFTATRAGDVLLGGPASYIGISASQATDSNGWSFYVASLVENAHTWSEKQADYMVGEFMRCKNAEDNLTPCSVFVSNVLEGVFNLSDFNGFRDKANVIRDFLEGNPGLWEKLGNGTSQPALTRAQAEANSGHPVVAVWKNPSGGPGHIALIIPGVLRPSSSWDRLVPNAAQTRLGDHLGDLSGVWIGRPLSNSFGSDKQSDVDIFVRR